MVALSEEGFGAKLLAARELLGVRIEALFPENGAVAKAMLLGDRSGVEEELLEAFRSTGVLHLMAVSGIHVSVLAGALSMLFRRNAWVRFFAVAAFLAFYAGVTAFSPSVVRAGVMLLYYFLSFPLARRPDGPSALAAACVVVLLANPFALFTASFQLSFLAVYGLTTIQPLLARPLERLGSKAASLISGSLAVLAATLPAMAGFFSETSLMSLFANVLVLPIAPLFLVPGFVAVALSFLSPALGTIAAAPARLALNCIVAVVRAGGELPLRLYAPGTAAYLLYILALLLASPLCLHPPRRRALYASVCLAASFFLWGAVRS